MDGSGRALVAGAVDAVVLVWARDPTVADCQNTNQQQRGGERMESIVR